MPGSRASGEQTALEEESAINELYLITFNASKVVTKDEKATKYATVLGSSFLAKKVLVDAISQAGVDTAISHRMMDAVFGYAGADDTEWIAKIQNKIEKNGEVQAITQKVMNEITEDLSSGKAYKDVDVTKELNRILDDSMQEIKDTNPELNDDMLAMMKQQLKEELVDVQDVLNSYASNLYNNMNDTSTVQGKVAKLYTILLSMPCRVAAGAAILILAVLTILLGYPRYRGLFSLGVEGLICSVIFAPGIGLMGNKVPAAARGHSSSA